MYTVLLVIHALLSLCLIALILLQQGRGADMGAAFGSGASSTIFGAQGSASFLTRMTAVLATLFFVNSLALAYLTIDQVDREGSLLDQDEATVPVPEQDEPDTPEGDTPPEPPQP